MAAAVEGLPGRYGVCAPKGLRSPEHLRAAAGLLPVFKEGARGTMGPPAVLSPLSVRTERGPAEGRPQNNQPGSTMPAMAETVKLIYEPV